MEHATNDHIMDMQINNTPQQRIQLYRVVKAGQLLHQGRWFMRDQVQHKFPHLMEAPHTIFLQVILYVDSSYSSMGGSSNKIDKYV